MYSVLLGSLCLALQNVILRVIFVPSPVFGWIELGGWLDPSVSNAIFLLWFRTLVMAMLLSAIAPRLYSPVFSELRQLWQHRTMLAWAALSGLFLAISLSLLNLAISRMETGIAIGVFFTHSAWTVLLTWVVWGDRPSRTHLWIMGMIMIGVLLTTVSLSQTASMPSIEGSVAAISAAWVYASYNLTAQICLKPHPTQTLHRPMHPITFSLLSFWMVVLITSLSLFNTSILQLPRTSTEPLLIAGLWAAFISLLAYVLLNIGVSRVGAALTSLISALTPILSVLFAWVALNEFLQNQQILGVILVAIGIASLGVSMHQESAPTKR